jgi:hypothetical protein
VDPVADLLDEGGGCPGVAGRGVEQALARAREDDDGEVLALGLEGGQERDALVDRDLAVGGAIQPERRDSQLLQIRFRVGPEGVGYANPAKACELAVRINWGALLWRLPLTGSEAH